MTRSAEGLAPLATCKLQAHPQTRCAAIEEVSVDIGVAAPDVLVVRYTIVGAIDRLAIPAPGVALDPERLWAHTCCELFVAPAVGDGYVEWNFSPSGQLAHFAFSAYRRRVAREPPLADAPVVTLADRELRLDARVPLGAGDQPGVRISLTAVIEDDHGSLSYWALRHPCERPDFHHPDGFGPLTHLCAIVG